MNTTRGLIVLSLVLASNPGRLLTKEHLMEVVWPDTAVEEANLAYNVFAIRKALGENANGDRYIETVPKRGYRFVAPVVQADADAEGTARSSQPTADSVKSSGESTGTAVSEIESVTLETRESSSRVGIGFRWWFGLATGVVLSAIVAFFASRQLSAPEPANPPVHFQEPVASHLAQTGIFSVSPDGRQLLFAAEGADGVLRLWVRALSTVQPVPLPGTEVFFIIPPPVWSPDSRSVAFDQTGVLKVASLDGGIPQSLCELPGTAVGGSWNRDGNILLGNASGGLVLCPASGGRVTFVTKPEDTEQERHLFPSFLSDGRRFIYLRVSRSRPEISGIYVSELGEAPSRAGRRLITTGFGGVFVPGDDSEPGLILFPRDAALFAQGFDERRLELIGDPIRITDRIGSYLDFGFFAASAKTLVYRAPDPELQLTWFDRRGRELARIGSPARVSELALSPEGDRALVTIQSPQGTADQDLWLFDLSRNGPPQRVTFGAELESGLAWSTNDRFVYGSGGGGSGVYQQTIDGDKRLLFRSGRPERPASMSLKGDILLFDAPPSATRLEGDVWVRIGDDASATVRPLVQREKNQSQAQLSPDQRWVAYVSDEAGPNDVFVAEFRAGATAAVGPGQGVRISEGGGFAPRWRRDGRELFYLMRDGSVLALTVDTGQEFRPGKATRLFRTPDVISDWGVTPDGSRFLFAVPVSQPPPLQILENWQATLPKPAPR